MKNLTTRQKRFADLHLQGKPAGRAWEMAGFKARGAVADVQASKALRRGTIRRYLKEERAVLLQTARFEREQLLDWLVRLIRTPMNQIDEHSDLPQRYEQRIEEGRITYLNISLPNKIQAVKMICHLLGFGPPDSPDTEENPLLSLLLTLRNPSQN